jgi:serine/threonine protein kinase
MDMMDQKKCPRCGVLLGPDAPEGLCPGCLMGQGLGEGPDAVGGVQESDGRYVHLGEQGRGGMGRVLLVHDDYLDREIALKELMPTPGGVGADGEPTPVHQAMPLVARFLQEARITGQLEHPSIVPVYELGYRTDGTLYYTMKLVRGKTLRQAIAEAETLEKRLKLLPHFVDLCQAVAYAHSRKVIHRDIKPGNVMVGEFGETVVLDWGLAKIKDQRDVHQDGMAEALRAMNTGGIDAAAKTAYGHAMGTPSYMPPEQAAGHLDRVDERSDIYALGAVLHEILTGHPPFTGDSAQEILDKVQHGEAESIRSVEPKVPKELAAMCRKAMAKNPAKRYPTAKALAEAVAGWAPRHISRTRRIVDAVVLALVIIIPATFWTADWYTERLLNAEVEKIRAEGAPVSKEDINARTAGIPEGVDRRATKFLFTLEPDDFLHWSLDRALSKGAKGRISESLGYDGGYDQAKRSTRSGWAAAMADWSPGLDAEVRQILAKDQELLARIAAISRLPKEDPRIALKYASQGLHVTAYKLPNLLALRMACFLLLWDAVIALKEGRPDDAMDGCTASMNFHNHLDSAPRFLITEMISVALRHQTASLALEILRADDVSDAATGRFLTACAASHRGMVEAVDMERLSCMDIFDSVGKSWSEPYSFDLHLGWWWAVQYLYAMPVCRPWRQYDQAVALRLYDRMRSSVGTSLAEDEISAQSMYGTLARLDWTTPLTETVMPNIMRSSMQYHRAEAMVTLSQVAIALKKCRRDTGSYPADLSALAPAFMAAVPMDPITGKPLVYRLDNGKLTLTSAVDESTGGGADQFVWELAL